MSSEYTNTKSKTLLPLLLMITAIAGFCFFYFFFFEKSLIPPKDNVFYRHINIDPQSLHVTFIDPTPALPTPNGEFYCPFYGNAGCSVNHYEVTSSTEPKIRYDALGLTGTGTLETRTKDQVLWKSECGTVYANSFYEYRKAYTTNKVPFRVYVYDNGFESDPPTITQTSQPSPLSGFSEHPKAAFLSSPPIALMVLSRVFPAMKPRTGIGIQRPAPIRWFDLMNKLKEIMEFLHLSQSKLISKID